MMNFKRKAYNASLWMLRLMILFWHTIYNVGQYRDDIVYLAPISYYGATNTLRAILDSILWMVRQSPMHV
jgi:hypothetical protein